METWLVTGGAGFIGSNFVLEARRLGVARIINLDLLTYAGNPQNLESLRQDSDYRLVEGDIADSELVAQVLADERPTAVIHFAAESHVDRSILGPDAFVRTNVVGTFRLLSAVHEFWKALEPRLHQSFRFLQVSTDEVFGSLGPHDPPFTSATPYAPNSPYSASKAAADHFVRAYHQTYGFPAITTNCSNNYGPYQFPEKLVPLMIQNAFEGKPLPVYGDGQQIRDWLHVRDHCVALRTVLASGEPGATYLIGGSAERTNLEVVQSVCTLVDEMCPSLSHRPTSDLIEHVVDRPGHDRRYAIDDRKMREELGWLPRETFESGLRSTVSWYLEHQSWVRSIQSGAHQEWIETNYRNRHMEQS